MFPGLFEADAFSKAECLGAWRHIKSVRELNLFNREFQGMREAMVIYCLEVVNALLSCKIHSKDHFFQSLNRAKINSANRSHEFQHREPRTYWLPPTPGLFHQRQGRLSHPQKGPSQKAAYQRKAHCPQPYHPGTLAGNIVAGDSLRVVLGLYLLLALTCLSLAIMELYIWRKNGSRVAFYSNNFSRKYYDWQSITFFFFNIKVYTKASDSF